ncbi:MAG: metal ABC transporter ATP-binding protein [Chloroflexi bacterium]|nr:MAG: metal ABC transporter ATP-binding protein [Chloroflexota bacterium]
MQPIIELKDVTFGYGRQPILEQINLHLHPGQFAALVGPSGAGKTTLLKLMLQLLPPNHGQVWRRQTPPLRVAYVPQLETVDWNFPVTAEEVVLMGLTRHTTHWPWPRRAERKQARRLLAELGIGDLANRHIRDLSGGQQQRVFLARALIAQPECLVLDEPTTGVDMHSAETIFHLLADLNRQGMAILLTTHDLNMAAAHVPWIVCLNRCVIAQGPPEKVITEPILTQTYQAEMQVIRQDGLIFVHQKPHRHHYLEVVPKPVTGGWPGHDEED